MDELVQRVSTVGSRLWSPGDLVVVACSGGADSVALLHLLHRGRSIHRATLGVVTVDHGLREESADDAAFVEALSGALGIDCVSIAVDAGSSEAAARAARYAAFTQVEADCIALAHHMNDQVETVLLNLLRGTGPRGLAGMRQRRERYVRPLLSESAASLRAWLARHGLEHREDATNRQPRFLRNRIRHELVPLIEDLREGAALGLADTARLLREQDAFITGLADAVGPPPWALQSLPSRPVLRRALLDRCPGTLHRHIDEVFAAVDAGGGTVNLPKGRHARIRAGLLHLD